MLNTLQALIRDDEGASLVEYGLILALVTVLSLTVLKGLGQQTSTNFSAVSSAM